MVQTATSQNGDKPNLGNHDCVDLFVQYDTIVEFNMA